MNLEEFKRNAKQRIKEDGFVAIEYVIRNLNYSSSLYDNAILNLNRWKSINNERIVGAISDDNYNLERNKVLTAIISIINSVNDADIRKENLSEEIKILKQENYKLAEENLYLQKVLKEIQKRTPSEDYATLDSLTGFWLEAVFDQEISKRIFSISELVFNGKRNEYEYNGINFLENGKPFDEWSTFKLIPDLDRRKFYYIYMAKTAQSIMEELYGFGVVEIGSIGAGELTLKRGFFIDSSAESTPKTCGIIKLSEAAKLVNFNGDCNNLKDRKILIKKIYANKTLILSNIIY